MLLNVYKTREGVVVTIVIGFGEMQQRVKEVSSHFAVRQRDKDGDSLFEEFVLDEGYETRFRSLFYSAQGELTEYLSGYLKNVPAVSEVVETNKAGDEDWVIQLPMPYSFNESLSKAVGFKVEDFAESYIMYRWLEDKSPETAAGYLSVADKLKTEINANLNKRSCALERPMRYW
jgi:hypothetical protein